MRPSLTLIHGGPSRNGKDHSPIGSPVDLAPTDAVAFRLPVFANHKRNLAAWLRDLTETRVRQGKPVELSYGVAREIADLIEFGQGGAA